MLQHDLARQISTGYSWRKGKVPLKYPKYVELKYKWHDTYPVLGGKRYFVLSFMPASIH